MTNERMRLCNTVVHLVTSTRVDPARNHIPAKMPSTKFKLNRLFRRQFAVLLGFLSMALVMTLAACTQPSANNANATSASAEGGGMPTEFRIGYQVVPNAELLTKGMGLAEAKFPDVSIKWLPFDSSRDVNTAMVSGGIDVGLADSVLVSTGIAQNLPYSVYFIHDVIGDNEALAVTKASGIKTLADLPSKKIGVPFGSTTHCINDKQSAHQYIGVINIPTK